VLRNLINEVILQTFLFGENVKKGSKEKTISLGAYHMGIFWKVLMLPSTRWVWAAYSIFSHTSRRINILDGSLGNGMGPSVPVRRFPES